MLHFTILPQTTSIDELRQMTGTTEGWKDAVRAYDHFASTYYEKSPEELKWCTDVRKMLHDSMPEEFRTGCHLLWPQQSFMGEDIFVLDGILCTTFHAHHEVCGQSKLLNVRGPVYCAECQREVDRSEIKSF